MEQALTVVEQKEVQFYGDMIIAVRSQGSGVYVPVRPICDLLGVDWSAQRQRISRDPVLSAELVPCVVVTTTQGTCSADRTGRANALTMGWPVDAQQVTHGPDCS